MMMRDLPLMSVIVPVHDGEETLRSALEALEASDLPRTSWQLVVVDDSSSDESALVAAHHADAVVRLPGPSKGLAYARNRGAEISGAEYLVFVSADVRVRPDTLRRMRDALSAQPVLAGVSAVCEPTTSASLATSYRAARSRFAGERAAEDSASFHPDCGAIRRSAFNNAGMWDEWIVDRPRGEAADMSERLRELGYRVLFDHSIEVGHLREWSTTSVIAAELRDPDLHLTAMSPRSGVPRAWRTRLRSIAGVSTLAILGLAVGITALAAATDPRLFAVAAVALAVALVLDAPFYTALARRRGFGFALRVIPLHLVATLAGGTAAMFSWLRRHIVGDPRPHPAVEAFVEVGVHTWPPVPRRRPPVPNPAH